MKVSQFRRESAHIFSTFHLYFPQGPVGVREHLLLYMASLCLCLLEAICGRELPCQGTVHPSQIGELGRSVSQPTATAASPSAVPHFPRLPHTRSPHSGPAFGVDDLLRY